MNSKNQKSVSLASLTRYRNDQVIERFEFDYGFSKAFSRKLFADLMRYFWLSEQFRQANLKKPKGTKLKSFGMLPYYGLIDEMWHTFLLFSKDYQAFSEKFFGQFVHHTPRARGRAKARARAHVDRSLQDLIDFVYNELGADVADRWFRVYPQYSRQNLALRRLEQFKVRDPRG